MAFPARLFRPNGPVRAEAPAVTPPPPLWARPRAKGLQVTGPSPLPAGVSGALEFDRLVPPSGNLTLVTTG